MSSRAQLTITSPLTEDRDATIAEKTVHGRSILEQCTVIPPALVGTVHLQQLLVFIQLKLHPFAVWVAISVELGKHSLGGLLLVVDIKPSRGLGEEVG
jgi:hypothetical protein